MASRVAEEFHDGDVVNLGVGLPVLCADHLLSDREVLLHSEQGVLGYGPRTSDPTIADPYLVNARRQCIQSNPGMVFLDHAESFGLVRSGRVDVAVLGALEVSAEGDLANCWLPGRSTGLVGGAQDFAERAKRVVVMMPATTKDGRPKLVERSELVVTARRAVDLVVTDIGVWHLDDAQFVLDEYAPGWQPNDVLAVTHAPARLGAGCHEMTLRPA